MSWIHVESPVLTRVIQKVLKELSVEGLKVNEESDWSPGRKLRF